MIGCLRTCVRKQPVIALYFESENELKFYNLEARITLKTNQRHREEEQRALTVARHKKTIKARQPALSLSLPHQDDCKTIKDTK